MVLNVCGFAYVTCPEPKCGVGYYVPDHVYDQAVSLGATRRLFCPNGHDWHYTRSIADGLRDKIASLEKDVLVEKEHRDSNWQEYLRAMRSVAHWKGIVTRLKKGKS